MWSMAGFPDAADKETVTFFPLWVPYEGRVSGPAAEASMMGWLLMANLHQMS